MSKEQIHLILLSPMRLITLCGCVLFVLGIAGCEEKPQPQSPDEQPRPGVTFDDVAPPEAPKYNWRKAKRLIETPTLDWVQDNCSFLPLDAWKGQEFRFMPLLKDDRGEIETGYAAFRISAGLTDLILDADQAEGKLAKVLSVSSDEPPTIRLELNTGKIAFGKVMGLGRGGSTQPDPAEDEDGNPLPRDGTIYGIVLERDLKTAREAFLAKEGEDPKSLYFIGPIVYARGATGPARFMNVPKYDAVQVIDIQPSPAFERPIRFIIKTKNDKIGYVDINMSGTNVPRQLRDQGRFEDNFLITDPRATLEWEEEAWDFISRSSIRIGMTQAQVWAAHGEPDAIEFKEKKSQATEDDPDAPDDPDAADALAPANPDLANPEMTTYWIYENTATLLFEEGRLIEVMTQTRFGG